MSTELVGGDILNYEQGTLTLDFHLELGQASTLLTINTPVAIMLLSYTCVDKKKFRIFLVAVAALMTFIIQFLFRKAQSFNVGAGVGSNLCLNWDSFVQRVFEDRFIVKALWAGLVFLFFVGHWIPWQFLFGRSLPHSRYRMPIKVQRIWERIMTSRPISKGRLLRLPTVDNDFRQWLMFLSLTSLWFPVQPEDEGPLGESCGLLARSLRPV